MRRLADEIGVTPMALYHHIPSKKQLLDLAVDRVGQDLHIAHDGRPWIDQMRDYAMRWREELHRYRVWPATCCARTHRRRWPGG
jgi:AcrR family transcriptional regulator